MFRVSLLVPSVWTKVATGWTTTAITAAVASWTVMVPRDRRSQDCDRRGPPSGCRGNAPQGRSIRPDQRFQPYMPDMICAACIHRGHPASSCDMLAIALSVEHHKKQLLESEKLAIEETWVARWKERLASRPTPGQVMRAYCNNLYMSVDHLADAMDWDCWPEAGNDNVADE